MAAPRSVYESATASPKRKATLSGVRASASRKRPTASTYRPASSAAPARPAASISTRAGGGAVCDWQAAPARTRSPSMARARVRTLAGNFLIGARLNREGRRQISASGFGVVAVPDDGGVAARIAVDARGRGVANVLAHHGALDLPGPGAEIGEVVLHVDHAAHMEVAVDIERSRHDNQPFEDPARIERGIAVHVHRGEVRGGRGVRTVHVDIVAAHRVDEDDAVRHLVARVERYRALIVRTVLLGQGLVGVELLVRVGVLVESRIRFVLHNVSGLVFPVIAVVTVDSSGAAGGRGALAH